MKKILFATAALVAIVATSCTNNTGADPASKQKAQLSLKLSGVVNSRGIQEPGSITVGTIELTNGHIFVLSPTGAVTYNETLNVAEVKSLEGQVLLQDVASDSRVFIIGNIPTGNVASIAALTTLTAIKNAVSAISTQTNYKTAALANLNCVPEQINVFGTPDNNDQTTVEANVVVSINPLISRLELGQVTGNDAVTGFTVSGVYVDDWYPSFTYGGSFAGTKNSMGTVLDIALGDEGPFVATQVAVGDPFIAIPEAGKVWAHNVAAGSLPRFIIVIDDLKYMVDADGKPSATGTREITEERTVYLTVTGYSGVTAFERGKIYRIGGGTGGQGIVFTPDDVSLEPNPVDVTLQVNVNIVEWDVITPDPIL